MRMRRLIIGLDLMFMVMGGEVSSKSGMSSGEKQGARALPIS
jgi:hypothetical protein